MKQADVKIGDIYEARVSGNLVPVRVLRVDSLAVRSRTRFICRNEETGREIRATAARLRRRWTPIQA